MHNWILTIDLLLIWGGKNNGLLQRRMSYLILDVKSHTDQPYALDIFSLSFYSI